MNTGLSGQVEPLKKGIGNSYLTVKNDIDEAICTEMGMFDGLEKPSYQGTKQGTIRA